MAVPAGKFVTLPQGAHPHWGESSLARDRVGLRGISREPAEGRASPEASSRVSLQPILSPVAAFTVIRLIPPQGPRRRGSLRNPNLSLPQFPNRISETRASGVAWRLADLEAPQAGLCWRAAVAAGRGVPGGEGTAMGVMG
ncbi:hypothetical protein E2C01_054758 [Portunus trituberculatus]|uniref:Uncharacterized protein n=1 Tax=Portunus trituberculatus TaxID=210409 RepID=A0A5B7GKP4_PORTR|nr:hypothetical protein [Portunus trituberculatus]